MTWDRRGGSPMRCFSCIAASSWSIDRPLSSSAGPRARRPPPFSKADWCGDVNYRRGILMRCRHLGVPLAVAVLLAVVATPAVAAERFITVASTTSTENSGLFGFILPQFQQATGIEVRVVAVGTGQAMKNAERGDADVLFVHHQPSEEQFVAQGFGVKRYEVMYNDYVLVGPQTDPAGIKATKDAVAALTQIAATAAPFVSRGDDSGTHKLELSFWQAA